MYVELTCVSQVLLFFVLGLAKKVLTSLNYQPSLPEAESADGDSNVRAELAERTGELSRLRDQMAEQQRELESVRGKLKDNDGAQASLHLTNQELVNCIFKVYVRCSIDIY